MDVVAYQELCGLCGNREYGIVPCHGNRSKAYSPKINEADKVVHSIVH